MQKVVLATILTVAFAVAGVLTINKVNLDTGIDQTSEENLLVVTEKPANHKEGELETPNADDIKEEVVSEAPKKTKANKEVKMFNHRTNEDIFFRPEGKEAKMFSKDGKELWSRTIDGEVVGSAKQVDTYNNKKYQAHFNTKTTTYCIDILGRDVKGYPKNR